MDRLSLAGLVLATTLSVLGPCATVIADDFSDLARVDDNTFMTVSDRKNPIHVGPRIALLRISKDDGIVHTPVTVRSWNDEHGVASDLEACCAIPERENEFLLAEGGLYNGRFGRIFYATLKMDDGSAPSIVINGVMRIYDRKLDAKKRSFPGDHVAGIACFRACGKTFLVFGERGGKTFDGTKVGTIAWGELDLATHRFKKTGESPLVSKSVCGDRDCSALHLIPNDNQSFSVLSVATRDPGDNGPFTSVIFRAGRLVLDSDKKTVAFVREKEPKIIATLAGLKVEGLAPPASNVPESTFSISTDDEELGGIWRAIKARE